MNDDFEGMVTVRFADLDSALAEIPPQFEGRMWFQRLNAAKPAPPVDGALLCSCCDHVDQHTCPPAPPAVPDREAQIEALAKVLCVDHGIPMNAPCVRHRREADRALTWMETQHG